MKHNESVCVALFQKQMDEDMYLPFELVSCSERSRASSVWASSYSSTQERRYKSRTTLCVVNSHGGGYQSLCINLEVCCKDGVDWKYHVFKFYTTNYTDGELTSSGPH